MKVTIDNDKRSLIVELYNVEIKEEVTLEITSKENMLFEKNCEFDSSNMSLSTFDLMEFSKGGTITVTVFSLISPFEL